MESGQSSFGMPSVRSLQDSRPSHRIGVRSHHMQISSGLVPELLKLVTSLPLTSTRSYLFDSVMISSFHSSKWAT